ncbi:MAG: hypothetical protein CM1200mP25_3150 [Acidobacteriota bacterium]|nr:MAG: hypothetical protein CM1200mP25_3150 [Acidobacteriota bacterium]
MLNFSHWNYLSYENRQTHSTPFLLFAAFLGFQLLAVLALIRYCFPWTWDQHLASGIWTIFFTCLACNFVLCFGEYFFHRYLLHLETVNFLSYFTMSHRSHHKPLRSDLTIGPRWSVVTMRSILWQRTSTRHFLLGH